MKEIPLWPNHKVLVDDDDYDMLMKDKWLLKRTKTGLYAQRSSPKHEPMHRFILKTHQNIDHINGNGLDNQKANLRACSHLINGHNSKRHRANTQYNIFERVKGFYDVQVKLLYKAHYLGRYDRLEDAIQARDDFRKLHGLDP